MYKAIICGLFILFFGSSTAWATCSSYPNTLTNGTTADATQVMANFNCAALTSGATIDSPTFTGTVTGAYTRGQIVGTNTNDNASAGNFGEYHSCTALSSAPVALTSGTSANLCSISVTAGDWQACGAVGFSGTPTGVTYTIGSINTTSATRPPEGVEAEYLNNSATRGRYSTGCTRFSLTSTTSIYLIATELFSGGSDGGVGELEVWRER
jgi:hypothetical protein